MNQRQHSTRRPPSGAARPPRRDARPRARAKRTPRSGENHAAKWLPVGAAGAVLVAVAAAGIVSGGGGSSASSSAPTSATSLPGAISPPTTVNQVVIVPTTAPVVKVPIDRTLGDGVTGDDVTMVQKRLTELGFDPGPADGVYGGLTIQAVWAFEKLIQHTPRSEATGKVTPDMWSLMQDPLSIAPRRPNASTENHTEIYLPEQVMVVFHGDAPAKIVHISSGKQNPDGTPYEYSEDVTIDADEYGTPLPEPITKPIKGLAKTPPGVFEAGRKVIGTRNGPLGDMWDPIYINQGIAIHGALNVPLEPASHGCIRVARYIGSQLHDLIAKGDQVYIWDGKKEPEEQSEKDRQMIWDWLDTSRTTTTSSTTSTTVPPSTVPTTVAQTTAAPTTAAPTTAAPTTVATTAAPTTIVVSVPPTNPPAAGG